MFSKGDATEIANCKKVRITTSNTKRCVDIRVLVFDSFETPQSYFFLAMLRAVMTIFSSVFGVYPRNA